MLQPIAKPKPAKKESLLPHGKLLKVLQFIAALKADRWTTPQLMKRFDMSRSSVYRYIELLSEAGFCIENDFHNRHFIVTSDEEPAQAQFTREEMAFIRQLIVKESAKTPQTKSILKKLSLHSELDAMPRLFLKAHLSQLTTQLHSAIRSKRQVILKSYHSASSNKIGDRLVEPIHFDDNYTNLIALDLKDKKCKHFKLDRVGYVEETKKVFRFESRHEYKRSDVFGIAGELATWVTLRLSTRAWLLLREEFPLASAYVKKEDNQWVFNGPIAQYQGIGRFVMGLLDEIEVIGPDEFVSYLKQKVAKFKGINS